jgi:hypothetical protein
MDMESQFKSTIFKINKANETKTNFCNPIRKYTEPIKSGCKLEDINEEFLFELDEQYEQDPQLLIEDSLDANFLITAKNIKELRYDFYNAIRGLLIIKRNQIGNQQLKVQ